MSEQAARTDSSLSMKSDEFIWETADHVEAHRYLLPPITRLLAAHGASTILDFGCGNGSLSHALSRQGYRVFGVDSSASGIANAREKYPGVHFEQFDIHQAFAPEHSGRFDAVVSAEVIEHLLLPRKLLENALLALRPGGILVLTTPFHGYWKNLLLAATNGFDAHWHPLRDYGHVKFFSRSTILQLFRESGFSNLTFTTAGRIPALAKSMIVCGMRPS